MFWKAMEKYYDEGLLAIRLSLGLGLLYYHGWADLMGGPERWARLGRVMNSLGIHFGHTFFGFMATFSETLGALCIALGLFFQPMLALLSFTMLMAGVSHYASGRGNPGNALTFGGISLGLIFVGPGKYSLDALIQLRKPPPPDNDRKGAVVSQRSS